MLAFKIGAAILMILASLGGLISARQKPAPSGMRRYFWLFLWYGVAIIAQGLNTDPVLDWVLLGLHLAIVAGIVVTVVRLVRRKKESLL